MAKLICPHCGQDNFTRPQGLSGHIRMAHNNNNNEPPVQTPQKRRWFQRTENEPRQSDRDQTEFMEEVKQLIRDFAEAQIKEMSQAVESTVTQVREHLDASGSQNPPEFSHEQIQAIGERIGKNMARRHPIGLCDDNGCQVCPEQRREIQWQSLMKIEERVPGTRDKVAEWQLMNTPIEIIATDEEIAALNALP